MSCSRCCCAPVLENAELTVTPRQMTRSPWLPLAGPQSCRFSCTCGGKAAPSAPPEPGARASSPGHAAVSGAGAALCGTRNLVGRCSLPENTGLEVAGGRHSLLHQQGCLSSPQGPGGAAVTEQRRSLPRPGPSRWLSICRQQESSLRMSHKKKSNFRKV